VLALEVRLRLGLGLGLGLGLAAPFHTSHGTPLLTSPGPWFVLALEVRRPLLMQSAQPAPPHDATPPVRCDT